MGLYHNRIQAPTKTLAADWIPEEGELFRDSAGNLYCGDNVTASNALTPVSNGAQGVKRYRFTITGNEDSEPPSVTVWENSLGGTVVWSFNNIDNGYEGTLTGAFPSSLTVINPQRYPASVNDNQEVYAFPVDNYINVKGYDAGIETPGVVQGVYIEVTVYPA